MSTNTSSLTVYGRYQNGVTNSKEWSKYIKTEKNDISFNSESDWAQVDVKPIIFINTFMGTSEHTTGTLYLFTMLVVCH